MEETGAGTERVGDRDMEVEEMLKEAEKSADEVERVEKDVMEVGCPKSGPQMSRSRSSW